jgi:hypothetical protein
MLRRLLYVDGPTPNPDRAVLSHGLTVSKGVEGMRAHAGLFAVASLMRQKTLDALKRYTGFPERQPNGTRKPRLLFTGHSAGSALLSLYPRVSVFRISC